MREERVSFHSDGDRVSGVLRLPEDSDEPVPGIVQGPGFGGTKGSALYARVHDALADAGYASLVFDYRGYGESEGERRLLPSRQVRTIRDATTVLGDRPEVDADRLGAFGHGGTGGGNAVTATAADDRLGAVVCSLGIDDGAAWLRSMRSGPVWDALTERVDRDVASRVTGEDGETIQLIGEVLFATPERAERFGDPPAARVPLADVRELASYRPIDVVHRVSPRGALFVCVEGDDATPAAASRRLYEAAGEPRKLVTLRGTTHYGAYEDRFDVAISHIVDWYDRHLVREPARVEEETGA